MSKNLKETTIKILKQLNRNPAVYSIFIAIFGCGFFVYEFFNSFSFNLNTPIESWVATATYFNNVFSPILLFVSILLLYRTWKDSKEALEVQKKELEATKFVLKEQSDTQNFSVFKAAICEVTDTVEHMLETMVLLKRTERECVLYLENTWGYNVNQELITDDECKMTFKKFLEHYFTLMHEKPLEQDTHTQSFKRLLISTDTFPFIEKIKTIALLFHKQQNNVHRDTLEIIVFHKLSLFTWLMFVEISFYLFKNPSKNEQIEAELVFDVISGLTCRQLKEVYWLDSLSDEALHELKKQKLI